MGGTVLGDALHGIRPRSDVRYWRRTRQGSDSGRLRHPYTSGGKCSSQFRPAAQSLTVRATTGLRPRVGGDRSRVDVGQCPGAQRAGTPPGGPQRLWPYTPDDGTRGEYGKAPDVRERGDHQVPRRAERQDCPRQRMNEPNRNPSPTAIAMLITPGMRNGWLNTYLPIWVVPVSSICTAARSVAYVGRTNIAETAGKAATAATGARPIARAVGMRALVVAAWEYSSVEAKNNTTASIHGWLWRRSLEKVMISFSWAVTNVVPSHATPSTQIAALVPHLNVDAEGISFGGTLHTRTMTAAMANMMLMIAASRAITGSAMRPILGLMAVAYPSTPSRPTQKISTDSLALGAI